MALPNFFVLGAPKAGTTALYDGLRQHPSVAVSEPKEPHFFDVNYARGLEWYEDRYLPEGGALIGEATPHYLFCPYVPERIESHVPDARLIAILRDPVERAYSDWWMYWSRATEPLAFGEAIASNLARLEEGPSFLGAQAEAMWTRYYRQTASGAPGEIEHRPYVEMGHYAEQIRRYREVFGPDRFLVLFFDDFVSDSEDVVRRAWRFLGLDDDVPLEERETRENAAMGGVARHVYAAARSLGVERALHVLPRPVREGVKSLTAGLTPRPSLPTETERRLREHYAPRITELEALLGRDLSAWKG